LSDLAYFSYCCSLLSIQCAKRKHDIHNQSMCLEVIALSKYIFRSVSKECPIDNNEERFRHTHTQMTTTYSCSGGAAVVRYILEMGVKIVGRKLGN